MPQQKKIIFLDRDGTINRDSGYITKPELFELLPGVPDALVRLRDSGYEFIIITNQGGIALGLYTIEDMKSVNDKMLKLLAPHGVSFLDIFYCPHHVRSNHPSLGGSCGCRKPAPGMFQQAYSKFSINRERSWMIGDKVTDVEAGRAAGVSSAFLGTTAPTELPKGTPVFGSLLDFSEWLVNSH